MADYKIPAKFTERITFLVKPEMKAELAELAFKKQLPLAEYLRSVLQKELDKNPQAKIGQKP
jgi:hypothetical protein